MLNAKYLSNNNKLKKKIINLFIPMLFGFKANKLKTSFYYEHMYYKIFYLIFNHISVIKRFFNEKKIFYNFSKYFQINLYIYLIKKKLMILNLFFNFFYTLFLTFENLEDISTNRLFFKGYKRHLKHKRVPLGWIKPDQNFTFYYKQRFNSISLYVLNFNIYYNIYFSKYNLFLIHTKLIYKLFYYFKILQYKLQSFILRYKWFYRMDRTLRIKFAKANCILYKKLNAKLVFFFSVYKSFLKKDIHSVFVNSVVSNIVNLNKNKSTKTLTKKPFYTNKKIKILLNKKKKLLLNKKKKLLQLNFFKKFKNFFLANHVFKLYFKIRFDSSYFNLFYNNILKVNWLKQNFLKNKVYYKKIFINFLRQFLIKYSLSIKLMRRYDIFNNYSFQKILTKFHRCLKTVLKNFILNLFNLNLLINKAKVNFINFIMNKFKFKLLLNTISHCGIFNFSLLNNFSSLNNFYSQIFIIFDKFLNKNFNSYKFHHSHLYQSYSDHNSQSFNSLYAKMEYQLYKDEPFIHKTMSVTTSKYLNLYQRIKFKLRINSFLNLKNDFLRKRIRNKFSNNSLTNFSDDNYYNSYSFDFSYETPGFHTFLDHFSFKRQISKKKKFKKKIRFSIKLIELLKKRILKQKEKRLLIQIRKKLVKTPLKLQFTKSFKFNLKLLIQKRMNLEKKTTFLRKSTKLFNKKMIFFNNNKVKKKILLKKQNILLKRKKQDENKLKKAEIISFQKKVFNIIKRNREEKLERKLKLIQLRNTYKNSPAWLIKFRYNIAVTDRFKRYKQKQLAKKFLKKRRYSKSKKKGRYKSFRKLSKHFKKYKKQLKQQLKKQLLKYIKKNFNKTYKKKLVKQLKENLIKKYGKRIYKKYKMNSFKKYKTRFIKKSKKKLIRKYKKKLIKNYKKTLLKKYGFNFIKKYNKKKKLELKKNLYNLVKEKKQNKKNLLKQKKLVKKKKKTEGLFL
jgi:hypothetical protein